MLSTHQARQRGFTLIELVVVIVIIGILAAFAIPRFANLARDARISSVNAMAGALRSTAALTHGMALAQNQTALAGSVSLEGTPVTLVYGYPAASDVGIIAALQPLDPNVYVATHAAPVTTITVQGASGATPANCKITYTAPTAANTPALITVSGTITTDC